MRKDPLQPGCFYHIYNRGNNKENIFKEPKNYNYFLELWKQHIYPVAETYTYSMLPNHFHSLIRIRDHIEPTTINQSFSNFFNAYTKSINKAYHRTGSLFQERFGRKMVEKEKYLIHLVFYIHANVQNHGLVTDFRKYPHSSYVSMLSTQPTLLERSKVLAWFGGQKHFEEFHRLNHEALSEYLIILQNEGY
jgi:putative transposase